MKARRQVVVKGSSLPVLRIVVRDGDAHSLRSDLIDTIERARPVLADAIPVLDLRERHASDVASSEIVDAVVKADVRLAAILIGESKDREALARYDLPVIEAPLSTREPAGRDAGEAAVSEPEADSREHATGPVMNEQPPASRLAPLYLTRPLRSGQRFYAQGRDAVVAAPTSRGSEIIADGSVYAFAPLRGRVLAGASGDANACIVASHLDAELVAIAGVYRTLEPEDLKAHDGKPVSITLSLDADGGERLTLATLALSSSTQRN